MKEKEKRSEESEGCGKEVRRGEEREEGGWEWGDNRVEGRGALKGSFERGGEQRRGGVGRRELVGGKRTG